MYIMDVVDKIIYKVCPFVAGGIFVGSVYWTAVTYGAVTVMQVGHIRPPLKKMLFPVQRPGEYITAEWEPFFSFCQF